MVAMVTKTCRKHVGLATSREGGGETLDYIRIPAHAI